MPTYQMKGGHTASDPRLGRVPQWDPRNDDYHVRELQLPTTLRTIKWCWGLYLDQGRTSECVGCGWAEELAASPIVVQDYKGRPLSFATTATPLYERAQQLDEWPGENYDGTSVLAGAKAVAEAGYLTEYRWATTVDDVLQVLSSHGPVVLGTDWREDMFDPDPATGVVSVSGSVAGGHCYLARGLLLNPSVHHVRATEPLVRCRQSWGRGWGLSGDFYLPVSGLERLLGDGADACVPVHRSRGPRV